MPADELQYAQALAERLQAHGSATLVYFTAEFQPFSNSQRPDILFIPSSGGRTGQRIVIEIKISTRPLTTGRSFSNLIEHRDFCSEALEAPLGGYVFVSNSEVPEFSEAQLRASGIVLVRALDDPSETATLILAAIE